MVQMQSFDIVFSAKSSTLYSVQKLTSTVIIILCMRHVHSDRLDPVQAHFV